MSCKQCGSAESFTRFEFFPAILSSFVSLSHQKLFECLEIVVGVVVEEGRLLDVCPAQSLDLTSLGVPKIVIDVLGQQ